MILECFFDFEDDMVENLLRNENLFYRRIVIGMNANFESEIGSKILH